MSLSLLALSMALSLVFVALALSRRQRLDLEQEILISAGRAFIQLMAVGYLLQLVFDREHPLVTGLVLLIMVVVASQNAAQRGRDIPGSVFVIVFIAIGTTLIITLGLLVGLRVLSFSPWEAIPIGGMITGNAMIASGLVFNRLREELRLRKKEVEAALALGATSRQAVAPVLKSSVRAGMIPTVDGMKTVGIVQLPGMMTGFILAGGSPLMAVRFQVLVVFMMLATVTIACLIVGLMTYRRFFTPAHQLISFH